MPFASYLHFIVREPRFLGFGFLAAFSSSFGQTFFIGIFGPGIQAEFELSHTVWGTIYMLGTTASALLLPWTGRQIDHVDLRLYVTIACALLAFACVFITLAPAAAWLVLAIFLLRHAGQGLMSHTAMTSMARYFDRERGRAIALASTGFAAGEALMPVAAVLVIGLVGWRQTYLASAALLVLVLAPALLWLCRGHTRRHLHYERTLREGTGYAGAGVVSWQLREVLRDPRFYLLLPGVMAPGFILTAMFFHHLNLADAKGWSHAWITGHYAIYAVVTTLVSLLAGALIDRLGAVRVVPLMLLPLAAALLLFWGIDSRWAVWPYFVFCGVNVAISHTAATAMWAEVYGVEHIGAIKSLAQATGVLASALGPVTMGVLADLGMPIVDVTLLFAVYCVIGTALMKLALRRPAPPAVA